MKKVLHKAGEVTWLMVEVPRLAEGFSVMFGRLCQWGLPYCDLPNGNWEYVGKGDSISEEVWKEIVEWHRDSDDEGEPPYQKHYEFEVFKDYANGDEFRTATESGHSLLKSHGMQPSTTIFLKQVNG